MTFVRRTSVVSGGLLLVAFLALMPYAVSAQETTKPIPVYLPAPTDAERELLSLFDQRTELAFADVPIRDVMEFVRDKHKANIVLDAFELHEAGIDESTPITIELSGITLRTAFRLILEPLGLTWIIRDEVILITTQSKIDTELFTRIYPVADLAESAEELEVLAHTIEQGTNGRWITLLPVTVPPQVGGTISEVPRVHSLVVKQSQPVHEEIVELLTQLRAAQALVKPH